MVPLVVAYMEGEVVNILGKRRFELVSANLAAGSYWRLVDMSFGTIAALWLAIMWEEHIDAFGEQNEACMHLDCSRS